MFSTRLFLLSTAATLASGGSVFDIPMAEVYSGNPPGQGNQLSDAFYLMNVTFGTPPQHFTILPDTGSPDTWVQGPALGSPAYEAQQSSTFVNLTKPWLFEYGGPTPSFESDASGFAANETISILGTGAKLTVKSQTFAVAQKANGNPPPFAAGIFGLTHDPHVSSYNAPVFLQDAIADGSLSEPLFGVHLTRAQDARPRLPAPPQSAGFAAVRQNAGKLTLGGVDTTLFDEPITFAPLQKNKGFWQIAIDGIFVNGKLVESSKGHRAIADTGTSILLLPPKVATDFFDIFGGKVSKVAGLHTVACSTVVDVKVKIAGKFFPIKAEDLNLGFANKAHTQCFGGAVDAHATNASKNGTYPSKAKEIIVLGLPLLLSTYTVFDYSHGGRVGFATLKHNGNLPTVAPLDVAETAKAGKTSAAESDEEDEELAPRAYRIGA